MFERGNGFIDINKIEIRATDSEKFILSTTLNCLIYRYFKD